MPLGRQPSDNATSWAAEKPSLDIEPGTVNTFCSSSKRPDQLQGLDSHLFNWYYLLSRGVGIISRAVNVTADLHTELSLRLRGAVLPHMTSSRAAEQLCSTSSSF